MPSETMPSKYKVRKRTDDSGRPIITRLYHMNDGKFLLMVNEDGAPSGSYYFDTERDAEKFSRRVIEQWCV